MPKYTTPIKEDTSSTAKEYNELTKAVEFNSAPDLTNPLIKDGTDKIDKRYVDFSDYPTISQFNSLNNTVNSLISGLKKFSVED